MAIVVEVDAGGAGTRRARGSKANGGTDVTATILGSYYRRGGTAIESNTENFGLVIEGVHVVI